MTRRALVAVLLLVACHHKKKLAYVNADGSCYDPNGCVAVNPADFPNEYKAPDEDHPGSGDPGGELKQASCDDVGHALASMDLGNWADEDTLAPAIAKHKAACVKLRLDQDERQCVYESTDKDGLAYCAPRMVPGAQVATVPAKDCGPVTDAMRPQRQSYGARQDLFDRQMAAIEASCAHDRWTPPFRDCVKTVPYPTYIAMYCAGSAPAPLRKKVNDRLAAVK